VISSQKVVKSSKNVKVGKKGKKEEKGVEEEMIEGINQGKIETKKTTKTIEIIDEEGKPRMINKTVLRTLMKTGNKDKPVELKDENGKIIKIKYNPQIEQEINKPDSEDEEPPSSEVPQDPKSSKINIKKTVKVIHVTDNEGKTHVVNKSVLKTLVKGNKGKEVEITDIDGNVIKVKNTPQIEQEVDKPDSDDDIAEPMDPKKAKINIKKLQKLSKLLMKKANPE